MVEDFYKYKYCFEKKMKQALGKFLGVTYALSILIFFHLEYNRETLLFQIFQRFTLRKFWQPIIILYGS